MKQNKLTYFQCVRFLLPFLKNIRVQCIMLIVFECIVWYFTYEIYSYIWNKLNYNVRIRLFSHMQEIEAEEMSGQNYGDLMVMIRWYTMDCVHFFVRDIVYYVNNYIQIIACMVVLFLIDPILGVAMIFMVPVSVFVSMKFGKKAREASDKNK